MGYLGPREASMMDVFGGNNFYFFYWLVYKNYIHKEAPS